jgi:hypothetical protein
VSLDLTAAQEWLGLITGIFALLGGIITAFWAYTKYVVERGLLPSTQFYIECRSVGIQNNKKILEILLHLKNIGNYTLVASNIRVDLRYLKINDNLELFKDPRKGTFGRLDFRNSLIKELVQHIPQAVSPAASSVQPININLDSMARGEKKHKKKKKRQPREKRGFLILGLDTFVQAGVDQVYTFVTALPESTSYVLIWASFEYEPSPTRLQSVILFISRRLGLIQYSLAHVEEPHTAESVFKVS